MTETPYAPDHIDECLDCTGLRCPLPLLRTKQQLHRLAAGSILEVVATDAGAERDIPAWLRQTAHRLLGATIRDGHYIFWIARGTDQP